jgi:hypothetical protein
MDPYLEDPSVWMDFHERFVTYCSDALIAGLPDHYDARIEERISLVKLSDEEGSELFCADVAVSKEAIATQAPRGTAAGVLTLEPVSIPLVIYDEIHESKVHILRRNDRKLVTVVELLSPSNKVGEGMQQYHAKRNSLLTSRVHLVEIDLLVEGTRPSFQRELPAAHYAVFVSRVNKRPNFNVFTWSVRQPLPTIPIPLEAPDPDLILDLADLFRTTYERGRYGRTLRYQRPPSPRFDAATERWAMDLVCESLGGQESKQHG